MGSASVSVDSVVLDQPVSQLPDDEQFIDGPFHQPGFNSTNYYALLSSVYALIVGNITSYQTGNSINFVNAPASLAVTQ
jgi:hypothetical protein